MKKKGEEETMKKTAKSGKHKKNKQESGNIWSRHYQKHRKERKLGKSTFERKENFSKANSSAEISSKE